MKLFFIGLLIFLFSYWSPNPYSVISKYKDIITCSTKAKCYGRTPCAACSNCSACAHCTSGGSCGICQPKKGQALEIQTQNKKSYHNPSYSGGQCRAITKKGTRCKRSSSSKGYCWQHG